MNTLRIGDQDVDVSRITNPKLARAIQSGRNRFLFNYSDGPHTDKYQENGHTEHTEYRDYKDHKK